MNPRTKYWLALDDWSKETFRDLLFNSFKIQLVEDERFKLYNQYISTFGDPRLIYEYGDILDVKDCFREDFENWAISKNIKKENYKQQKTFKGPQAHRKNMITVDCIDGIKEIIYK